MFLTRSFNKKSFITSFVVIMVFGLLAKESIALSILPNLGNVDSLAISKKDEKILGRMIIQDLHAHEVISKDVLINDYIVRLGKKISFYAPLKTQKYKFFVVDNPELNAFAFFDGHVGVHLGAISIAETESDLAAIMAHEVAHVSQKHLSRLMAKNKRLIPLTILETIAAVAIGAPDLAIAAAASHQANMLTYTREFEKEADRIGIQILSNAGFDPQAMANIFYLMQRKARYEERPPEYLITHPIYENRIADARHRANEFPYVQSISSLDFHLVKARTKVLVSNDLSDFIKKMKIDINDKKYTNEVAANYSLAFAYLNVEEPQKALATLNPYSNQLKENIFIQLLLSSIYEKLGNKKLSHQILTNMHNEYPENAGVLLQLARHYINDNKLTQASKTLKEYCKNHESLEGYDLMVMVQSKLKNQVKTHLYKARWFVLKGELEKALNQLALAKEHSDNNIYTKASINSLKKQIYKLMEEQKNV